MPVNISPPSAERIRKHVDSARRSLQAESEGMEALANSLSGTLGEAFAALVELLAAAKGRVIVSGMGKSGHIARKIAATLASTGTPSHFVHPAEASHGDLGMITRDDVVVLLSNSGESAELKDIIAYTQRFAVPLVAFTAYCGSTLAKAADVIIELPQAREACPNGLAPTTSTLLQLAMGDALAVALLEERGFTARHFRDFHPGGKLGAALKHAADIMRKGEALPLAGLSTRMRDALVIMTEKACGCLGIVDDHGKLSGIITDGDLRRHMSPGLLELEVRSVMTADPKSIPPDMLAVEVLELLNSSSITTVFVVGADRHPLGLIHIHDLLRIGAG
jgi:arabinose-5-phosphate isomerase